MRRLPTHVQHKQTDLLQAIRDGAHPRALGGRKLREYPNWWSLRLPGGYRLLLTRRPSGIHHHVVSHNDYDKLLARGKNAGFLAG